MGDGGASPVFNEDNAGFDASTATASATAKLSFGVRLRPATAAASTTALARRCGEEVCTGLSVRTALVDSITGGDAAIPFAPEEIGAVAEEATAALTMAVESEKRDDC